MNPFAAFLDGIEPAFRDGDPAAHAKAAEAGHVGLVREMYAAAGRGDFDAFTAAFADDVELDVAGPPELPFAGRWRGKAQVLDAVRHNFSLVEDQRPAVESVVAQGDTVVVMFAETGRVRATGKPYSARCVQAFTFRGGKLARVRQVVDSAPIVAACRG